MSVIVFRDVTKTVRTKKIETVILHRCSFAVESGMLTVLIGPSGCGKTTVINFIAGYETPDSGEVLMDGRPVSRPDRERLVIFQESALFPWLTCYENVMFGPLAGNSISRKDAHEQAAALLEKVGLKDYKDKYPMQLSGGMQRRVELARALINKPKVMLMDEPFRGLDAMTRELMQEYYLKLFEESRITNLFVTSELEEAIFLADKIIIMTNKPGRVKKIMDIDLPRPRTWDVTTSSRYINLKAEALELVHEEAVKGKGFRIKMAEDVDLAAVKM